MNIYQKLKGLVLSGVCEMVGEDPVNRLTIQRRPVVCPPANSTPMPVASEAEAAYSEQAATLAAECSTLADLYRVRDLFDGCPLKKTAAHTLNGHGVNSPAVLCLVATPDREDEKAGSLFAGAVGAKADQMLGAIGLDLQKNTYVSALIPWRPPGNRKPTPAEIAACQPFWEKEIDLLNPKLIIAFGSDVSKMLLQSGSLSKMRGSWHSYRSRPLRVCIAPAMVIKQPEQRRPAWEDIQAVRQKLTEIA